MEIIYRLWYRDDLRRRLEANDEASGEALRVTSDALLGDAGGAVAVVCDAPVEVREDAGVDASYPAVVGASGVLRAVVGAAVGGEAAEEFDVGLERKQGSV